MIRHTPQVDINIIVIVVIVVVITDIITDHITKANMRLECAS